MSDHDHTNRLIDETSPYLLQHAHNPVDWHPWGEEAIEEARRRDKPIFLSIGYSACHWCHVMERESFEDEAIAEVLNAHFVPVKVDREERPDIDRIYMNATQILTGQGGWPMSVFLTPELQPFYAGTYFPPEDKWGRPGFKTVLEHISELWEEDRRRVDQIGERMTGRLQNIAGDGVGADESEGAALSREPLEHLYKQLDHEFDETHGGFGSAPKFPSSMNLRALLKLRGARGAGELSREQRDRALEMVEKTLVHMASGGMYDQIGGGFHRYSTDEQWLVPHFEKMLYDNAMLTQVYVEAWQVTGRDFYRRVARESCDWALREMTLEHAEDKRPFYSTQDADSEGEEGKFFVWTPDELEDVLGEERAERAAAWWDIQRGGNWEGKSIPNRLHALEEPERDVSEAEAVEEQPEDIRQMRRELFEARSERVAPGTDTKVLASWNGLMIAAMARAGWAFDEPEYVEGARDAARFVLEEMIEEPGEASETGEGGFELMRTYKDGRARITGYLDDYAFMANGLVELFEATGEPKWLQEARRLADRMIDLFAPETDEAGGAFFYTGEHHENLLVRDKDQMDNATPSGNSRAAKVLLKLSALLGEDRYRDRAEGVLKEFSPRLEKVPHGMGEMLQALDWHLSDPLEVVVALPDRGGSSSDRGGLGELNRPLQRSYLPHAVRVLADLSEYDVEQWAEITPLMEARQPIDDQPTVYVCRRGTCKQPVTEAEALEEQLR